jgi:hypothetical protein
MTTAARNAEDHVNAIEGSIKDSVGSREGISDHGTDVQAGPRPINATKERAVCVIIPKRFW